jgi:hypothetical protein
MRTIRSLSCVVKTLCVRDIVQTETFEGVVAEAPCSVEFNFWYRLKFVGHFQSCL